jgi:hypothetical protein
LALYFLCLLYNCNIADVILESIKQNNRIDLSDGLDKRRTVRDIKGSIQTTTTISTILIFKFFNF